jgi:lysophospholipid acyltransferase (LPLAT)-like uncharacterized protein
MSERQVPRPSDQVQAADDDTGPGEAPVSGVRSRKQRGSRSKRRMTLGRRFLYWIGVPIGMLVIRFFWHTCRIVYVDGRANIEDRLLRGETAVICYWHRHQLFCWRYLRQLIDRGARIGWLISASVDGHGPSEIARRMGGGIVFRGSTTSGGTDALRTMCKAIARDHVSPATTPDGPYGPHSVFKPGIVKLAQLSGVPLIPLSYYAERAWVLRTWDRFVIPKPFCRIVMAAGEPVPVPRRLDEAELERIRQQVERELQVLFERARARLQSSAQSAASS